LSTDNQTDASRQLLNPNFFTKGGVMGKKLPTLPGEMAAHLPMLQSNLISILPEETDYE